VGRSAILGRLVLVCVAAATLTGHLSARESTDPPTRRTNSEGLAVLVALRLAGPIMLDGRLLEPVWGEAEPTAGLRQRDPNEGQPETERTEVRVAYDDDALYIGARLFDREPAQIVRRLSRRDLGANSDTVTIYLDPQHDHRTGVLLRVSAAGSQADALLYDDNSEDFAWDGVWDAAVSVDAEGWSAELRIPFSQLRFRPGAKQTWGLNVARYIHRKNEESWWELVPKTESRLVSSMGHLAGIDNVPPKRHLDLLPYIRTGADVSGTLAPANPLRETTQMFAGGGLDVKWGLTSSLTMDAAVNPDFGQVEVDPAVVNLSAFETFYEEKRPFFIEGGQLYTNFGRDGLLLYGRFGATYPSLYYSRRIGRAPQLAPAGEFVDSPESTAILGAGKLTGRTASGWNVAFLDALTGREFAKVANGTERTRAEIEPLTNYIAARASRDFGRRGSAGFLATSVIRDLRTSHAQSELAETATVAGADGHVFFDAKGTWVASGSVAGSVVAGDPSAVLRLQRSSARYFQRPDAGYVAVDPGATRLSGWTAQANINRRAGRLLLDGAVWAVSPGFEANDLGYSPHADRIGGHVGMIWRKTTPDRFSRSRDLTVVKWWVGDFGGDRQVDAVDVSADAEFRNYWYAQIEWYYSWTTQDDRLTRGGPSAERLPFKQVAAYLSTDQRKTLSVTLSGDYGTNTGGAWGWDTACSLRVKPSQALTIQSGPQVSRGRTLLQYVRTVVDPYATATYGSRYVFADINQTEVSLPTRVDWMFSPRASFQLYAQPLIAVGDYWGFKELARPRVFEYSRYGTDIGAIAFDAAANRYTVDPDEAGAAAPFSFGNPDFNFRSIRFNAVFRWEWRLGSTLYVAWTQRREDDAATGQFHLGRDLRAVTRVPSDNVFMVKIAYWFSR
jgi:hypothetical protein